MSMKPRDLLLHCYLDCLYNRLEWLLMNLESRMISNLVSFTHLSTSLEWMLIWASKSSVENYWWWSWTCRTPNHRIEYSMAECCPCCLRKRPCLTICLLLDAKSASSLADIEPASIRNTRVFTAWWRWSYRVLPLKLLGHIWGTCFLSIAAASRLHWLWWSKEQLLKWWFSQRQMGSHTLTRTKCSSRRSNGWTKCVVFMRLREFVEQL